MPQRKRRLRELEQKRNEAASKCQKLDQFFRHKSDEFEVQLEQLDDAEDEVEMDAADHEQLAAAQLSGPPTPNNLVCDTQMVTDESTTECSSPQSPVEEHQGLPSNCLQCMVHVYYIYTLELQQEDLPEAAEASPVLDTTVEYPTDPGHFMESLVSTDVKEAIVQHGPCQPKGPFQANHQGRRFCADWYK